MTMVSSAPSKSRGRNEIISSIEKYIGPPAHPDGGFGDDKQPPGSAGRSGAAGGDPLAISVALVVVPREVPLGEYLLHLELILHPLERARECVAPLNVALPEGVAAVAHGILEGARLVALDELDRPFRMLLEGCGEHRLVVDDAVDPAQHEILEDLLPVLDHLQIDALDASQPLRIVGAVKGRDLLPLHVGKAGDLERVAVLHR